MPRGWFCVIFVFPAFGGSKVNSAMAYCKFQADQIFTGHRLLDHSHILITDPKGTVIDITTAEAGDDVRRYPGILIPGQINCHCHLELSHLRNRIPEGQGLPTFIQGVMQTPMVEQEEKNRQMDLAEDEMYQNGIVGIGDISNHSYSIGSKLKSKIRWHHFLEITNPDDEKAKSRVAQFRQMEAAFAQAFSPGSAISLSPHAIYSVSPQTLSLINTHTKNKIISIHNQECADEDEWCRNGSGGFIRFYESIGRKNVPVPVSGKQSVQTWLPYFNNGQTILLVHNTFMQEEDIVFAQTYALQNGLRLVYCFCPNANLYIEKTLPQVDLFIKHQCDIVIGTDSYASNHQLSITGEMAALHKHFPQIPVTVLLQWATLNGAKALRWDRDMGSFDKGKRPGIVLLESNLSKSTRII